MKDSLNLPDILLMLSDEIVVFDNISGTLFIINYVDPAIPDSYESGIKNLQLLIQKLQSGPSPFASFEKQKYNKEYFSANVRELLTYSNVFKIILSI